MHRLKSVSFPELGQMMHVTLQFLEGGSCKKRGLAQLREHRLWLPPFGWRFFL